MSTIRQSCAHRPLQLKKHERSVWSRRNKSVEHERRKLLKQSDCAGRRVEVVGQGGLGMTSVKRDKRDEGESVAGRDVTRRIVATTNVKAKKERLIERKGIAIAIVRTHATERIGIVTKGDGIDDRESVVNLLIRIEEARTEGMIANTTAGGEIATDVLTDTHDGPRVVTARTIYQAKSASATANDVRTEASIADAVARDHQYAHKKTTMRILQLEHSITADVELLRRRLPESHIVRPVNHTGERGT